MNEFPKGHNNPPQILELSRDVIQSISHFMAENPTVPDHDSARAVKIQIDRAKLGIRDLEDERDAKVRPMNEAVAAINLTYRKPKQMLTDLIGEMANRLQVYIMVEEERRRVIAEEAAARAMEAELIAKKAEALEKERLDDIAHGEVGIDIAEVIAHADDTFDDFQRAERARILTQKETRVVIGGGPLRSLAPRDRETLDVIDAIAAVKELGVTESIKKAILTSARSFRRLHNRLPSGIASLIEKVL